VFCTAHHDPKYFYVDETRKCIQCGSEFTFRAAEQKYWYETLKFNFSSVPVRCVQCRRQRRSEHALREQIAQAKSERAKFPRDPQSILPLPEPSLSITNELARGALTRRFRRHGAQASSGRRPLNRCSGKELPIRGLIGRLERENA